MIRMLARIKVADFAEFIAGYELPQHQRMRESGGVLSESVQYLDGDPTQVLVIHDFADIETAQSYTSSAQLFTAMHDDGVEGHGTFEFFVVH